MNISMLRDIPTEKVILLAGLPGAGKTTFCQQCAVQAIAEQTPVIFVSTETTPETLIENLRDRGLGESVPKALGIVDAYTQTVGLVCSAGSHILCANCADLNSLSIAVTKLRRNYADKKMLLIFDSLTSPYLFNGSKMIRFIQQFLSRFALEGNAVVAVLDDGCGKESDLGAIKSVCDGIIHIDMGKNIQTFDVIKHPKITPSSFDVPFQKKFSVETAMDEVQDATFFKMFANSLFRGKTMFRPHLGDYVNAFWPKLAYWSGMLWDPNYFPKAIYQHEREDQSATGTDLHLSIIPQPYKTMFLLIRALRRIGLYPRNFSRVGQMKRVWGFPLLRIPYRDGASLERCGKIEYLPEKSKTDEHYYRVYESSECWDLNGVGSTTASHLPPSMAGQLIGMEAVDREWNAVETKCIGLGDDYCEIKITPGENLEFLKSLEIDAEDLEKIHARLIDLFVENILSQKILTDRPESGQDVHLHVAMHAFGFAQIAGERSKMALRMGGAKSGKEIAEGLLALGLEPEEVIGRTLQALNQLKVGVVSETGNKIRIEENIEPLRTKYMTRIEEPSCYFTTGFLNGLFQSATGLRVRETKCVVSGDRHCEWEIL